MSAGYCSRSIQSKHTFAHAHTCTTFLKLIFCTHLTPPIRCSSRILSESTSLAKASTHAPCSTGLMRPLFMAQLMCLVDLIGLFIRQAFLMSSSVVFTHPGCSVREKAFDQINWRPNQRLDKIRDRGDGVEVGNAYHRSMDVPESSFFRVQHFAFEFVTLLVHPVKRTERTEVKKVILGSSIKTSVAHI